MKRILQAMDGVAAKPVEGGNDMSKFLSIIDKNNVEVLNEGANPHKVSLPVQMAMNHYQEPVAKVAPTTKKPSLLKQYFAEAEKQQEQELAVEQEKLKMYSQKIAKRVLEARLAPDQIAKLQKFKQQNAKPLEPQKPEGEPLSAEKQAEIEQWGNDLKSYFDTRTTVGKRTHQAPIKHVQQSAPAPEPEERSVDVDSLSLPELQNLLQKVNYLIRVMEEVEKLSVRAEKFPGGLTPGLAADLDINVPTPTNAEEYDAAIEIWSKKLEKLKQFIALKKATWAKKKTPVYENQEQQATRDPRVIQQEIKAAEKEAAKIDYTLAKVREVTKEIKYDDTAGSIILRIRKLAETVPNIDSRDLKYAEEAVFEAIRALESSVYGLEEAFTDAARNAKYSVDELESELSDMQWNKKFGTPEV